MITFLAKKFIPDYKNYGDTKVREGYGVLTSIVGVFLNICLFALKLVAGTISGSISVTADAFNNLTDAGSSIITFIGFKLAGKPTDKEHPFGHGRMEYLAGLLVSIIIFLVAYELITSSIEKISGGASVEFSLIAVIILCASVAVKLYMFIYNSSTAKKIDSAAMQATARDSISDCLATTMVLICLLIKKFSGLEIDAYVGILVALFILYNGIKSAKETIGLLLGEAPDPGYIKEVCDCVLAHEGIVGLHDLIVHNYGPGRQFITLHAEVPSDMDVNIAHDIIDDTEKDLNEKFGCIAVLHMDPIVVNDKRVNELKAMVLDCVKEIDASFMIHDFRITEGGSHINLIFDMVIPHSCKKDESAIMEKLNASIKGRDENCNVVCKIEYSFTE